MKFPPTITLLFAMLVMLANAQDGADAMYRTLVSDDGKSIKAKLVCHAGGKLTIRREDGNEFEVDPAIFCKQDEAMIAAWMKENPAKVDYRLKADANRKKASSSEYSEQLYYEIEVRNDGQDAVKDIKVMYRILYENWGAQHMQEGEHLLEQELEFNRTLVLKSEPIRFSRARSARDNGMRGCLIRVLDPKGEVVMDWVSNDIGMKDVTWASTNPKAPHDPTQEVEIR